MKADVIFLWEMVWLLNTTDTEGGGNPRLGSDHLGASDGTAKDGGAIGVAGE